MGYIEYKNAVVDCNSAPNLSTIKGKSVIITGGAGGMGEQGVRAFAAAGAFVTFGDVSEESGKKLEAELAPNVKFEFCDVTKWQSQLNLFKSALANSPSKTIDVVVANAGITGPDPVFYGEDAEEPEEPHFKTLDVNMTGTLYTLKLARFYFLKNPEGPQRDRCFIILSSLAGYADVPGGPVYMASKFAARALMRCVRRTTVVDGIRACALAPWFMATGLMSKAVVDHVRSTGAEFAEPADAAAIMTKIASDQSINGRCFTVVPKSKDAPFGYYDMDVDDYPDGSKAEEQQIGLLMTSHRVKVSSKKQ